MNGETRNPLLDVNRRVELRQSIALARTEAKLVVVTPDELDELLDGYEHGRFQSRAWLAHEARGE